VLDSHVVFIGAAIGLYGTLLYARDTLRGVTQPNRVTWLLWAVAPMLAFVDELHQGVGLQSVMTLTLGVGPLLVLLASFANKGSVWRIGPFDIACGLASVAGIVLWLATSNATVALISFMTADAMAGLPTLVKSWKAPETESAIAYVTALINALLTLATVDRWSTAVIAFPIQIVIFNSLLIALIGGRLGPRLRHEPAPVKLAAVERVIAPTRGGEPG
jgi:hypothetical protein